MYLTPNGIKFYNKEDLNTFKKDKYGRLICPTGDYSEIRAFNRCCVFDKNCIFDKDTSFGECCSFGEYCIFSRRCSFGKNCVFEKSCSFGKHCLFSADCFFKEGCLFSEICSFGVHCWFEENCSFEEYCSFGDRCQFTGSCSFHSSCSFGERCNFNNYNHTLKDIQNKINRILKIDYIGLVKSSVYFFKTSDNIYVRYCTFFGTLNEFDDTIDKTYMDNKAVEMIKHIKTILLKEQQNE